MVKLSMGENVLVFLIGIRVVLFRQYTQQTGVKLLEQLQFPYFVLHALLGSLIIFLHRE